MAYSIKNNIIKLTRGDTLRVNVGIIDENGNGYTPVEGDVVTFTLKKKTSDETEEPKIIDIPIDTMELKIESSFTKEMSFGIYYYDIQIQFTNGDVYTFITPTKFIITEECG